MRMPLPAPVQPRRAATLVETTLVLSITMLFMMGLFEYARFVYLNQVMNNAAREGARYAVVHTGDGTTQQNVKDYVTQQMAGRDVELANVQIDVQTVDPDTGVQSSTNWNDATFGKDAAILVRIQGDYAPLVPTFLKTQTSIHVKATAMMSSEAN